MGNDVRIKVNSDLESVIEQLKKIRQYSTETSEEMKQVGKNTETNIKNNLDRTTNFFTKFRGMLRQTAGQIKSDFKSLVAIESLGSGLKLSQQFKDVVSETLSLNDAIRKLGPIFGIAGKDFASFQSKLTKGLGDIGLSSEAAANALAGLAETQVRGQENLVEYSKTAGMLASMSREQGKEGGIAKGMAELLRAQGLDPNNVKQMQSISEDLRRVFNATGKGPTETLKAMTDLYAKMDAQFRKTVTTRGLAQMAAASQAAGPNATAFLERYLSMSKLERTGIDKGFGFEGVVSKTGEIDIEKFKKFAEKFKDMVPDDRRMAFKAAGLSDDEAEGFIRLSESLDKVKAAQDAVKNSTGSLADQYRQSMGLQESFKASINKIKGVFGDVTSHVSQGLSGMLGKASESTAGAAAVVGGGAVLSAMLTGGGLRGIMSTLKGRGAASATEALTGEKVQNVYVVNASEIAAGGGAAGAAEALAGGGIASKAKSILGGGLNVVKGIGTAGVGTLAGSAAGIGTLAAGVGAAGYAGYKIGEALEPLSTKALDTYTTDETKEGFKGNAMERLFFKLDRLLDGKISGVSNAQWDQSQKIMVEVNEKQLRKVKQPSRGGAH